MTTQTREIAQGSFYPLEGALQYVMEGTTPVFACVKQGVTTIANDATLIMYVYKGSTDKTSTYTTGAMSATGNVAITYQFTSLIGGDQLHVVVIGTCDGMLDTIGEFDLKVRRKSGK